MQKIASLKWTWAAKWDPLIQQGGVDWTNLRHSLQETVGCECELFCRHPGLSLVCQLWSDKPRETFPEEKKLLCLPFWMYRPTSFTGDLYLSVCLLVLSCWPNVSALKLRERTEWRLELFCLEIRSWTHPDFSGQVCRLLIWDIFLYLSQSSWDLCRAL